MTRRTITIEAPNGVKIRTALGKRLYAVRYGRTGFNSPPDYAKVIKRTDSAKTAYHQYDQHAHEVIVYEPRWVEGKIAAGRLTRSEVKLRADAEKAR